MCQSLFHFKLGGMHKAFHFTFPHQNSVLHTSRLELKFTPLGNFCAGNRSLSLFDIVIMCHNVCVYLLNYMSENSIDIREGLQSSTEEKPNLIEQKKVEV